MRQWRRHLFYTKKLIRTTWKFRLGTLVVAPQVTRGVWTARIGESLVYTEKPLPSDVLLSENFNPNYLVFERAAELEKPDSPYGRSSPLRLQTTRR